MNDKISYGKTHNWQLYKLHIIHVLTRTHEKVENTPLQIAFKALLSLRWNRSQFDGYFFCQISSSDSLSIRISFVCLCLVELPREEKERRESVGNMRNATQIPKHLLHLSHLGAYFQRYDIR